MEFFIRPGGTFCVFPRLHHFSSPPRFILLFCMFFLSLLTLSRNPWKSRPGLDKSSPGGYTKQQSRALQLAVGSGLTYFIRQPSPGWVAVVPFCDTYLYGKTERMRGVRRRRTGAAGPSANHTTPAVKQCVILAVPAKSRIVFICGLCYAIRGMVTFAIPQYP